MSVLLMNGEVQSTTFESGLPVNEIVQQYIEPLIPDGQIVCMVNVDDQIEDVEALRWGEFDRLEIQTAHPFALVLEGLESANELINSITESLEGAASQLRLGEQAAFSQLFINAVDNLLSVMRFFSLTRAHLQERAEPLGIYESKLKDQLDALFQAQQLEDSVLMADIMEYELIPIFKEWDEVRSVLVNDLEQLLAQYNTV